MSYLSVIIVGQASADSCPNIEAIIAENVLLTAFGGHKSITAAIMRAEDT